MKRWMLGFVGGIFFSWFPVSGLTAPVGGAQTSPSSLPGEADAPRRKWQHRADSEAALVRGPDGEMAHEAFLDQWRARQREVKAYRGEGGEGVKAGGISRAGWSALGPGNVPGRARGIAVAAGDSNLIYAAAATGGIWRTTDGGANWAPLSDDLASLVINTIAIDPVNPLVLYASTGEESTNSMGAGVFKSADGGTTWAPIPANAAGWVSWSGFADSNFAGKGTNRLSLHPLTSGTFLVATQYGIFRSTDAGTTLTRVYPATLTYGNTFYFDNSISTVSFNPRNGNEAIAATWDGRVGISRDAGLTWTFSSVQPRTSALVRMEVSFAPSVPGKLYALYGQREGKLFMSGDYGQSWSQVSTIPAADQGFDRYKNTLWVSPVDDRFVLAGAVYLYSSRDGGVSWGLYTNTSGGLDNAVHADVHFIASQSGYGNGGNKRLWLATDGGLYVLDSSDTLMPNTGIQVNGWRPLNGGMTTSQAYHIHADATRQRVAMGTQDNGAVWYREGLDSERSWQKPRTGGDVMNIWVDPGSNYAYYAYQFLELARLDGDTGRWERICDGLADTYNDPTGLCGFYRTGASTPKANFRAPLAFDNIGSGRLLAGGRELWRSVNPRAASVSWVSIKAPVDGDSLIAAIGTSAAFPDRVWVAHSNGAVFRSTNATAAQPTWLPVSGLPARAATAFFIDPSSADNVLVTLSGTAQSTSNLWLTRDGGVTWQALGGSLPRVAFRAVTRHPQRRDYIYVGTDLGIYVSENDGATFSAVNDGPGNVMVYSFAWYRGNELLAGTYGRGVWKATVEVVGSVQATGLWWNSPAGSESGWGINFTQQGDIVFGTLFTYDSDGTPLWLVMSDGRRQGATDTFTGALYRTTGPVFNSSPFNSSQIGVTQVGTMTVAFGASGTANLDYTVNGVAVSKTIVRQAFGSRVATCSNTAGTRISLTNYQDLWWNPSESGWGINLTHQDQTLFGTLFTYGENNRGLWLVMSAGVRQPDGSFYGELYRTRGPVFSAVPFNSSQVSVTPVGTMRLAFSNGESGTLSYTVNGVQVNKTITRQVFSTPLPTCN